MRKFSIYSAVLFFCLCLLTGAADCLAQEEKQTVVQEPQIFTEYEGRYEFNRAKMQNFVVDLTSAGGSSIRMKLSHRQERTFVYESRDKFTDSEIKTIKMIFERDDKNKIKGLLLENFQIEYYFDKENNVFSQLKKGDYSINAKKLELPPPSTVGNAEFRIKGFPNAQIVALAGSFNNWNQSKNLCTRETDAWVCRIDLASGRYTYKFIVDGAWMIDPANKEVEADEYGNRNSVVIIKAAE